MVRIDPSTTLQCALQKDSAWGEVADGGLGDECGNEKQGVERVNRARVEQGAGETEERCKEEQTARKCQGVSERRRPL